MGRRYSGFLHFSVGRTFQSNGVTENRCGTVRTVIWRFLTLNAMQMRIERVEYESLVSCHEDSCLNRTFLWDSFRRNQIISLPETERNHPRGRGSREGACLPIPFKRRNERFNNSVIVFRFGELSCLFKQLVLSLSQNHVNITIFSNTHENLQSISYTDYFTPGDALPTSTIL